METFRVVGVSGLLVLGVLVVMLFVQQPVPQQTVQPVPIPGPEAVQVTEPVPIAPSPVPAPAPPRVQPARGDFAEFSSVASLRHPEADPNIARWYEEFGYLRPGDDLVATGEWVNKDELWNTLAPAVQGEARQLGRQYRKPMWSFRNPVPILLNSSWSNTDTRGYGDMLEFIVAYERDGQPTLRYWPVVIQTLPGGRGEIVGRMRPFDVAEKDYGAYTGARESVTDRMWTWLWTEGPASETPG